MSKETKQADASKNVHDIRPLAWLKQNDEGDDAYQAFEAFRDMAPCDRGVNAVASAIGRQHSQISRWKYRHEWDARVFHFDAHRERSKRDKHGEAVSKMHTNHDVMASTGIGIVYAKLAAEHERVIVQKKADTLEWREAIALLKVCVEIQRVAKHANRVHKFTRYIPRDDDDALDDTGAGA